MAPRSTAHPKAMADRKHLRALDRRKRLEATAHRKRLEATAHRKRLEATAHRKRLGATAHRKRLEATEHRKRLEATEHRKRREATAHRKRLEATELRKVGRRDRGHRRTTECRLRLGKDGTAAEDDRSPLERELKEGRDFTRRALSRSIGRPTSAGARLRSVDVRHVLLG